MWIKYLWLYNKIIIFNLYNLISISCVIMNFIKIGKKEKIVLKKKKYLK